MDYDDNDNKTHLTNSFSCLDGATCLALSLPKILLLPFSVYVFFLLLCVDWMCIIFSCFHKVRAYTQLYQYIYDGGFFFCTWSGWDVMVDFLFVCRGFFFGFCVWNSLTSPLTVNDNYLVPENSFSSSRSTTSNNNTIYNSLTIIIIIVIIYSSVFSTNTLTHQYSHGLTDDSTENFCLYFLYFVMAGELIFDVWQSKKINN